LGNIADPAALKTLGAARSKAGPAARDLVAEAYVACADQFAARGEKAAAITAYKQMLAPAEPRMIRIRALNGLTNAAGKGALALLRTEIESKDAAMQAAAIGLLNGLPGADITKVLLTEFPKVAPLAQVHLLTAMAERGDTSARPTVMAALKGSEREVRAAALAALGRLGDESTVKILAEAAAGTGPEQEAARRSLYTLRGTAIDRAIVAAIPSSAGRVKSELIMATGERVAVSAADALTRAARESDPDVRREALRALRNLGGVPQVPALLDLLLGASSGTERREASRNRPLWMPCCLPTERPLCAKHGWRCWT
jgi:HEAT repeat protein